MMDYYEKIESVGYERLLKKSTAFRESILRKCPTSELVCFFFFLTDLEWMDLFSEALTKRRFLAILPNDMFHILVHIQTPHLSFFIDKQVLLDKLLHMTSELLISECREHPHLLPRLLESEKEILKGPFCRMVSGEPLDAICELMRVHPFYHQLFLPLLNSTAHYLPFPKDVSLHVLSFM